MSKEGRSGRDAHAVRLVPSRKVKEATERCLAIATSLRERGDWGITSANVYQSWAVELGGERCRVDSVVSAFLEGPRGPGFVFNVTVRSVRGKRAIRERILSTSWFQDVQARLGHDYANSDVGPERLSLIRVLRGMTDPSTVLDGLRHIAAAIEGKRSARRRPKTRLPRAKELKEQREDVWRIIDALGPSGWRASSIAQAVQRQVKHDGCRWHVSTGFIALVESAENHPGFLATVDSWSTRGERAKRRNPISRASALLRESGYRRLAATHYQNWHRGLGLRAAAGEIELLERAMGVFVETR